MANPVCNAIMWISLIHRHLLGFYFMSQLKIFNTAIRLLLSPLVCQFWLHAASTDIQLDFFSVVINRTTTVGTRFPLRTENFTMCFAFLSISTLKNSLKTPEKLTFYFFGFFVSLLSLKLLGNMHNSVLSFKKF